MIIRILFLTVLCISGFSFQGQSQNDDLGASPKLIVGIVIDQMRYDYLTRFANHYESGGFLRLVNEGYNMKNAHYNYIPTYTGPGHASIFTGTTPKYHGIISNTWYDKEAKKMAYCAGDDNMIPIGTESSAGKMSPHRMLTTSFADENRLFTQMRGKTIGISIKDRGAILPAGHTANAAYWFHGSNEGKFISSSYYMTELPKWVEKFNESDNALKYLKEWNTLHEINGYVESGNDLNEFEGGFLERYEFDGEILEKRNTTFPYDLLKLQEFNGGYEILKNTPYGNSILTDFALAAIKGEKLGRDNITDILAISYSSTDYIGHNFGVNSKEVQDTYIRLDLEIERLLNALDKEVGKGEYIVFLTSDHGAVNVPAYLESVKIPAGYIDGRQERQDLSLLIFLNKDKIAELKLDINEVSEAIVNEIINYPSVDKAYSAFAMRANNFSLGVELLLQNGYNQKRSGDILLVRNPAFISYSKTGSTHGSGLNYDTHVPLIFFGKGIKKGSTLKRTNIVDIAPTISALLGISFPNSSTGNVLHEIID
jgi:predicted AlkP superfamily pyrophosphatase or phosphodiesterase